MLTKGAIGNLINRYRAVLKKCHLLNTFGSLAVASMMVMGGAGLAEGGAVNYADFVQGATNKTIEVTEDTVVSKDDTGSSLSSYKIKVADGKSLTLEEISGVKNVEGNGDVTINITSNTTALANGGTINVKNLVVNAYDNNSSTRSDSVTKWGSTTINATEDIHFATGDHAVHTEGGNVDISGRNIKIETFDVGRAIINSYNGSVKVDATDDVEIYASVYNYPGASDSGSISINAKILQ